MKIRNRIKGYARVPHDRIMPCPHNWRTHPEEQKNALRGVLADVGVVDTVLVRPADALGLAAARALPANDAEAFARWLDGYAGDFMLVDGHMRVEELQQHGLIDVLVLDLNDAEAAEILATFDPIGALAGRNAARLDETLRAFNSTNADVQALVAKIRADGEAALGGEGGDGGGNGAPDQSGAAKTDFALVITCESEAQQLELIDEFMERGLQCRALI